MTTTHHVGSDLVIALSEHLAARDVVVDPAIADAHAGDWSDTERERPSMVLFPRTPAQVAAVLGVLGRAGRRVVVQGGLTGLAGGAAPMRGEVAVSLSKLDAIEAFDRVGGTITVQAGATLERLQTHVEAEGWFFPLDLGARGSCQIGGNAATNAGGNRVVRYGTMRDLVLGIEVALADGTLVSMMNQVTKNTTGIDLKQLFIGSEGTLGVITRLVLKLAPKPLATTTALCALGSFSSATRLLKELRARVAGLSAFELMWDDYMSAAQRVGGLPKPFDESHPVYVLIETLGASDEDDRVLLERALERALHEGIVDDVIVAQSLDDAMRLWRYREAIGELLSALKPHAAFDVGVPMSAMESFVSSTRTLLSERFPAQQHLFFGHLGDGNLHVLSGPYRSDEAIHAVEDAVYRAVRDAGGCISAEHGIGVVKKDYLWLSRSKEELDLMRALKRLFDPGQMLNAGRIFDGSPR